MKIFGYEIKSSKKDQEENLASFAAPQREGDKQTYTATAYGGNFFTPYAEKEYENKNELIRQYRKMSLTAEVEEAIDDIVDEAIIPERDNVRLNLDSIDEEILSLDVKELIDKEFNKILSLLEWNRKGHSIFRRFYIDGRLNFHKIIDEKKPLEGIKELRPIDALNIEKCVELEKVCDPESGVELIKKKGEYYLYNSTNMNSPYNTTATDLVNGVKITKDSIAYIHCGIFNPEKTLVLSHLHRVIRPLNQLKRMEDAAIIYRLTRAPERRVIYVDTGNLNPAKSKAYVQELMSRFKNKINYNSETGEINDSPQEMALTDDFWLPRKEGGRGTEIATLPAGQSLGEIQDIEYFKNQFLDSLKIPKSRREGSSFLGNRTSEVNRDELKFSKDVKRIRHRFTELFVDILYTQLILKKIITESEWRLVKEEMNFDWKEDSYFSELKEAEILRERISLAQEIQDLVERGYYSHEFVRENILKQTELDIEQIDKEIKDEEGKYNIGDEEDGLE